MTKLKLNTFLIFLSFCTHSYAERVARFIYLNAPSSAPKEISILQETQETVNLKVLSKNFAEPFELGTEEAEIVIAPKGTVKDEEGRWKRFPKIKFSSEWEKVVIFFFEDEENSLFPVRGMAVNAGGSGYSEGDVMIMNLSKAAVVGTIGDKEVKIRPQSQALVKKPLKKKGSLNLSFDMKVASVEKALRLVRQVVWWTGRSRTMLFVVPGPKGKHPRYHLTNLASFALPEKKAK